MKSKRSAAWKSLPGPDDIFRQQLGNGITILCRSNFASQSVVVSGFIQSGSLLDPDEKLGLAYLTSLSLMRGTQKRTHQEIFDALETVGASFGFGASMHNTSFGGRGLAEDLPLLLQTLNECVRTPTFPADEIERLRTQILTHLAIREQDTGSMASLRFDQVLFAGHAYGRPEDGYPATIKKISQADLVDFQARNYGPNGMIIVVVGAVEPAQAVDWIYTSLGDWQNPHQPEPIVLSDIPVPQKPTREHIQIAGKSQVDLVMGSSGPKRSSPDYLPVSLGNNILGQFGLMGRIGDVVREKAGLAYYASTSLNSWIASGSWEVSAGINPTNVTRAINLINSELKRFVKEPVSTDELTDSQSNFIGRLPLSMESNSGVANAILNLERFNLGLDYFHRYPRLVKAITPDLILETARKYIHPGKLVTITAGPEIPAKRVKKSTSP